MATKTFSIEDGNLANKPITTSQTRTYKDIDLTFANKVSGDVFKKTDAASVKQSVKNILLTNKTERPFQPYFGGNLGSFLFSLSEEIDEDDIRDTIENAIYNFESRALVRDVKVNVKPDNHDVSVTVVFQVVSTSKIETLNISLTRLR